MTTALLWLRNDLRLTDNPALLAAATHARLLPVFILDTDEPPELRPGGASRWWLHESLSALDAALRRRGSRLFCARGGAAATLVDLAGRTGASHVFWNRRFEPGGAETDRATAAALRERGLEVATDHGGLLFEPREIQRADGGPFKVFTPFWKSCLRTGLGALPAAPPRRLPPPPDAPAGPVEALGLLPRIRWYQGMADAWAPGEAGALARIEAFAAGPVDRYKERRDTPSRPATSRLSPHLHFGEISPRQVLAALSARAEAAGRESGQESFVRQLGWREFAHHLLHHFPDTVDQPLNPRFAAFPWRSGYDDDLEFWQRGQTGIPLVDAGMRELWHTGWMHNRVRMVVASFLTKNLLIPWQEGARWFLDTLVDADLANNTLGWQWVAGSGADAAPYFRIFNPVLQGEKFDPDGAYVKHWVPELAPLPPRLVHKPWDAPPAKQRMVAAAGYPGPMVDLRDSRERALAAYRNITG